ncbi:MAG: hypothetical protein RI885_87 [Actinomycetota bacterium]|jgi:hypothetical protein
MSDANESSGLPDGATGVTSPTSERDVVAKQTTDVSESEAVDESNEEQVEVLPGTGGPDDVGDVHVDPDELNLSGDSIPGHPKPESH